MSTQIRTRWASDNNPQLANHILRSLYLQAWVRGLPGTLHQRKMWLRAVALTLEAIRGEKVIKLFAVNTQIAHALTGDAFG